MAKGKRAKRILMVLLAFLLAGVLAVPALAASERVDAVLTLLARLQRVDIDPSWPPDIEANQASVQQLLDLYLDCTDQEKAEFTEQQQQDLRAYFEVLYAVQGKDVAEVGALFTPAGSSSSSPPSSLPQSAPTSSLPPVSSQGGGQSTTSLAPLPSSGGQSQAGEPGGVSVPAPGGAGENSAPLGGGGIGLIVLAALGVAALVLFARFVGVLKRTPPPSPGDSIEQELRAQELFGENYDAGAMERQLAEEQQAGELPTEWTGETIAPFAPSPLTFAQAKKAQKQPPAQESVLTAAEHTGSLSKTQAPSSPDSDAQKGAPDDAALPAGFPLPEDTAPPPAAVPPPEGIGPNPDAPGGVTLRSFSSQPRTGRPGKMPFRQGTPEDIDAIDE